ncbi:tryptophan--tRNA ligase [Ostreibacterium oceani]|uniref:Tryptophan--tRNA ligase n=1 Tax=Ostreibacterium oceani TaxID=2654998 RepID=A0A6N7EVC5_9GAMM|nr:tryptophan--tRNA ligase [Ostreibacterium oceani]MPV85490.1 tryptophan--tRNA ligase [Ostreibacterium oceani]
MTKKRILTGITTTGTPHLGNYVGAIRPAIESTQTRGDESFFFLADYHGIIKCHEPARIQQATLEIAATWLACGLDPAKSNFYRQSDVPETMELTWVLNCVANKGLMNRAHAYKAAVDENKAKGQQELDHGVTMGLFGYPILMSADILIFKSTHVPVGKDQIQHIEMTRDIAQKFNHTFGEVFPLPKAVVNESTQLLEGLDGRKMSKSYDNTIPLFVPEKQLRQLIMKIQTNSQAPGEPKDPDTSTLFHLYQAFADAAAVADLRLRYAEGISWGDMKQLLFETINHEIAPMREKYDALMQRPEYIEAVLKAGADRVRPMSRMLLQEVRQAIGIRRLF